MNYKCLGKLKIIDNQGLHDSHKNSKTQDFKNFINQTIINENHGIKKINKFVYVFNDANTTHEDIFEDLLPLFYVHKENFFKNLIFFKTKGFTTARGRNRVSEM